MIDLPPPSYDETVQAIVQCDIAQASVRVAYEDLMQSDVVTISDLGELADQKLRCLKAAVHPSYVLMIENEQQAAAYYEFSRREDRPLEKARAREWLQARGMLDRVPAIEGGQTIEAFANALESACDLNQGSALMPFDPSALTFNGEYVQSLDPTEVNSSLSCLSNMFTASDAPEHGVSLGFIGFEAVDESDEH